MEDTKPIVLPDDRTLNIENVLASVAYGICAALTIRIFCSIFFPRHSGVRNNAQLFTRERIIIFAHAFILFVISALFYIPQIIMRVSETGTGSGSVRPKYEPEPGTGAGGTAAAGLGPLIKVTSITNDVLALGVLQYLVFLTWRDNAYVIGTTVVIWLMRAHGVPLVWETVMLILATIRLYVHIKTRATHNPYPPPPSSTHHHTFLDDMLDAAIPPPFLVFLVNFIAAGLAYTDKILHVTGVIASEPVKFRGTLMFFGFFLVQVIILTYWVDLCPICVKKQPIMLPEDVESRGAAFSTHGWIADEGRGTPPTATGGQSSNSQ